MSAEDDMFEVEAQNVIKIHKKRLQLTTEEYKKRLDYENKLVKMRRLEQILTRAAPMGGIGGMAFGMLQNIGQAKMAGYQRLKELQGKKELTPEETKEKSVLEQSSTTNKLFGKLDRSFEKHFGGNSKWNKFFAGQGKTAAVGLGLGAVGGGMALGKMIIDSSPAFQQMLKLLNFGIMLVLKPIGDFFGFLFRPILIMLLRKFIIPNYQKLMPVMIKMGTDIGNMLAGFLGFFTGDWIKNIDWGEVANTALKLIVPAYGVGSLLYDYFNKYPIDWNKILPTVPEVWGEEMEKNLLKMQTGFVQVGAFFSGMGSSVTGWLNKSWETVTGFFSVLKSDVTTWVLDRWNSFTSWISNIGHIQEWIGWAWDNFIGFFRNTVGTIWDTLGSYWSNFVNFFASLGNTVGYLGNLVGIKAADGFDGMVNKPTMMLVGERGSEHVKVTPHGKSSSSGTTVNINIANMSGDNNDVQRLRRVILEVMQSVNTNRGR